jgi:hypothetical protein
MKIQFFKTKSVKNKFLHFHLKTLNSPSKIPTGSFHITAQNIHCENTRYKMHTAASPQTSSQISHLSLSLMCVCVYAVADKARWIYCD